MANGDAAQAAFGWVPLLSSDDIKQGYDRINQLADQLAPSNVSLATTGAASTAGFVGQTGFQVNSIVYQRLGKAIALTAELTKVTSALTTAGTSDGDVANLPMFSLPGAITPVWSNGIVNAGGSGNLKGGYVSSTGFIFLTATTPNTNIAIGTAFNIDAMWRL